MDQKHRNRIIFILGALSAMSPFSIDMYLPGFAAIARDLGSDAGDIGLTLTSYFVGFAVGQVTYGPLLDRYGRKKPVILGLLVYLAATIGCVFAPSVGFLVSFRFFAAMGCCVGMVGSNAVIRDLFSGREAAKAMSLMGTVFGIAPIVAPTVGGLVVTAFGWRAIFIVLALLAIFVILAVWLGLPETSGSDASVSMRPRQIVSNYLSVFREPRFVVYAMVSGATTAGLFSYIAGSPFVFISLFGFSAAQYGWIFGGNAVALLLASVVNRMLLKRRSGTSIALFITGMQSAIGILLLVGVLAGFLPRIVFLGLIAIYLFGFGFVAPNTASASLQPFSRNVGSASALLGSIQMISGATASALVSYLHNGTAVPMALMMAVSACVSLGLAVTAASCFQTREEAAPL